MALCLRGQHGAFLLAVAVLQVLMHPVPNLLADDALVFTGIVCALARGNSDVHRVVEYLVDVALIDQLALALDAL